MTRRHELVLRAKLIGAHRRRDDLAARGLPLDDVTTRITEVETDANTTRRAREAPPLGRSSAGSSQVSYSGRLGDKGSKRARWRRR